jgi:N-methylhydantoinase A
MDWQKVNSLLAEMEAEGQALLGASGVPAEQIDQRREADIRYVGQGHEVRVPLPTGSLTSNSATAITTAFEAVYRRLYERLSQSVPLEIINWRVTSSGPMPEVNLRVERTESTATQAARKGSRKAYIPELGGYSSIPVYSRYNLPPGTNLPGPAIVEERESTIVVGPDCHFTIDEQWNLIVELEPGK